MRTVITTHQTVTHYVVNTDFHRLFLVSFYLSHLSLPLYQLNCVLNRDENRNNNSSDHHLFLVVISLTHSSIIEFKLYFESG